MEEHREKILQTRTLKRKVVKLFFLCWDREFVFAEILMRKVRAEFDLLPENFVLIIGIWGSPPSAHSAEQEGRCSSNS